MPELTLVESSPGAYTCRLGARDLWTYHHLPVEGGQPCFHPVNTPSGYTLSLLSPWDHPHHCALWFAWKLIDGVNAWEGPAYAPYQTRIVPVSIDPSGAGFVATYRWENEGVPLLRGQTICQSRLAGDDMYSLVLDYQFETPGDRPVLLDRNPPPTAGYAGLSIRVVREFRHAKYLDADGRTTPPPRGTPTAWQSYSGPIDGGPQRKGGVALLDNPTNLRFPAPTYCIHESTDFGFLQCAILYQESYLLQPSDPLRLRYQVILFDGEASAAKIQSRFDEFAQEAGV